MRAAQSVMHHTQQLCWTCLHCNGNGSQQRTAILLLSFPGQLSHLPIAIPPNTTKHCVLAKFRFFWYMLFCLQNSFGKWTVSVDIKRYKKIQMTIKQKLWGLKKLSRLPDDEQRSRPQSRKHKQTQKFLKHLQRVLAINSNNHSQASPVYHVSVPMQNNQWFKKNFTGRLSNKSFLPTIENPTMP